MKKLSSTILLLLFFPVCISAQRNSSLSLGEKFRNDLFKKDWSNLDHLISGEPKIAQNDNRFDLNLKSDINLNDQIVREINSDSESDGKAIEMPIHEPHGNYKMRVIKIDTTSQFYLKVFPEK